jgi:hypothetical protein
MKRETLKVSLAASEYMNPALTPRPGYARIHLNIERYRAPETYFSPSMAGVDTAGVGEVIQGILARFSEEEKRRLVGVRYAITSVPSALLIHSTRRTFS